MQAWISIQLAEKLREVGQNACLFCHYGTNEASLQRAVAQANTTVKNIRALSILLSYYSTGCGDSTNNVKAENLLKKTIKETCDPIVRIWASVRLAEKRSRYCPPGTEKDLNRAVKQASKPVKKITALSELNNFYDVQLELNDLYGVPYDKQGDEQAESKIKNILEDTAKQPSDPAVKYWTSATLAVRFRKLQKRQEIDELIISEFITENGLTKLW